MKGTLICLSPALLELASAPSVFAAHQVTPQPDPGSWWREMHWLSFGWIFPLFCFAMLVAMVLFMMRRGGPGCMWRGTSTEKSGLRDSLKRSWRGPCASALEILNERYASGEIEKQEYEEKKAAMTS